MNYSFNVLKKFHKPFFFQIRITFKDEEDVINPEDVDPTIGRFRNMIQTTVIPRKRPHPSSTESAADQEWASFQQATAETSSEKTSPSSKKASFTSPVKGNVFFFHNSNFVEVN